MSSPRQALLKRNTTYTPEQFSAHWLKHGSKVTPWALENGVTYYAQTSRQQQYLSCLILRLLSTVENTQDDRYLQIHNPRVAPGVQAPSDLNISESDGAAEMCFERGLDFKSTAKCDDYYQNVILPDERAFLVRDALQHLRWLEPGAMVGDRVVLIQDGKALIDCEKDLKIWNEWPVE
ncbi:hypothetical protein LTR10_017563 [Elasticomyces elasticus]|uniref:EthD domain-containing protein n=1 Tax=Exophiala sideris TaxID=1016849 RepID=A0ABR0IZW3_9EURO|nr:hypothetical protein LTR10_017563 [Elasticomyces elasticus]KAK5023430.1 hypothetical protein LTS07_009305 [Exophiala sideris]KAK5028195.1 hypothetical protein LTR13_009183 [Exophiala sideris]KAK5052853.1 hypothetical protein LTR69_009679 [Exophiala sideris]KAK5178464.1 hypothetical protein LTR44_009089 [Eurotiomycetes sp. CCFEE 6388]